MSERAVRAARQLEVSSTQRLKRWLPQPVRAQLKRIKRRFQRSTKSPETRWPAAAPGREVKRLEDRLWLGYERAATERLTSSVRDPDAHVGDRVGAALALTRWAMAHDDYPQALKYLHDAADLRDWPDHEATALEADCLCRLGRPREALHLLTPLPSDPSLALRSAHARSLVEGSAPHGSGAIIEALNRLYESARYVQITRRDVTAPVHIDNLIATAPAHEPAEGSPLISVIVPAYNCASTITTAIKGLLAQSWSNLEILVVDDHSTDETVEVVQELAGSDERVVLITNERNLGTYPTRNVGLAAATGDFITVHDADDWSHPQKLEIQANRLISDPAIVASGSYCIRSIGTLAPTAFDGRPEQRLIGMNTSSLMFRRSIFEEVGSWDDVRASGDGEFRQRVQARFGAEAVHWIDPDVPLSITRSNSSSLTGSGPTSFMSRFHALGSRALYRNAYQWWHASDEFSSELPFRPDQGPRPFDVPAVLVRHPDESDGPDFQTVFVGDLAGQDDFSTAAATEIRNSPNTRFGLVHIPAFGRTSHRASTEFRSLATQNATMLGKDAAVTCHVVVVGSSVLGSPRFEGLPPITPDDAITNVEPGGAAPSRIGDVESWVGVPLRFVGLRAAATTAGVST